VLYLVDILYLGISIFGFVERIPKACLVRGFVSFSLHARHDICSRTSVQVPLAKKGKVRYLLG
jgi:hypothetical protein